MPYSAVGIFLSHSNNCHLSIGRTLIIVYALFKYSSEKSAAGSSGPPSKAPSSEKEATTSSVTKDSTSSNKKPGSAPSSAPSSSAPGSAAVTSAKQTGGSGSSGRPSPSVTPAPVLSEAPPPKVSFHFRPYFMYFHVMKQRDGW